MNARTWGKHPVRPIDDAARARLLTAAAVLIRDTLDRHALAKLLRLECRRHEAAHVADVATQHTATTKGLRTASDAAYLPSAQPSLVLATAAPNSPNTPPTAHLINAVGLGGTA